MMVDHRRSDRWRGRFLPEQTTAAALLDRRLHHAVVVTTDGDSFRMKEARTRAKTRKTKTNKITPQGGDFRWPPAGTPRWPLTRLPVDARYDDENEAVICDRRLAYPCSRGV